MEDKNNVTLSDDVIDMLKEVGHICTGNATIALSQVLTQKVELTIPDLKLIDSKAHAALSGSTPTSRGFIFPTR